MIRSEDAVYDQHPGGATDARRRPAAECCDERKGGAMASVLSISVLDCGTVVKELTAERHDKRRHFCYPE
jgi:hypothetical protein